ncbi:MAG TPA: nuclear transport factor 2 family protein [Croceibacterium sp.]|nr:nuclear transport factor 2 family protein [Croceibacterium sp.]
MIRRMLSAALLLTAVPAAAQDLARETAKVEDLRSIREIKRLQAECGYDAMAGDWKAMAALATPDVEMVLPEHNAVGRQGFEHWLRQRMGQGADGVPAGRLNARIWFSPMITLSPDGQSATGRWKQLALAGEAGKSADWRMTTDVIEYRKTPEGWRMAHIRSYLVFAGPYETGFTHDAKTLERAPIAYSPDQAGTVLTGRTAAKARTKADLDKEATLLLEAGKAQNIADTFGYYLDRGMYDDIVDLFASEGNVEVAGQGVFKGADGVRRFLKRFGAPGLNPGELNDRPQLMPEVSISDDGGTALVRTTELGMTGQHGGEGYWSLAVDTFLLTRGGDGKWRIMILHRRPLMRATYKDGWAHPLPAPLPMGEGVTVDAPAQPVDTDYPAHAFNMQMLGSGVVFPHRGDPKPLAPEANALARAEAFDGAENVAGAYGEYVNRFDWDGLANLFARKGWRELPFIGILVGRDKILAGAKIRYGDNGKGPNPAFQAIHVLTQPYVTVSDDGKRIQLRERLMQFNSSANGPGSWIVGVYEDQLVKENGAWKMAGMDLDYTWMATYKDGWTKADPHAADALKPSPALLARYKLDAPIRGEPGIPFPRIAALPFHYTNPVSGRAPERLIGWTEIKEKK